MDLAARPESDESNGPGSQSPVLSTTGSRVLFVSGRHLVGDAIRVALESRGLEMLAMPVSETAREPVSRQRLAGEYDNLIVLRTFSKAFGLAGLRVGAALVVGDDLDVRQREAVLRLPHLPLSWLLLVDEPGDPRWSDLVAAGASSVVPSSVGLDDLVRMLDDLVAGRAIAWPGREQLEEEWRRLREEQEEVQRRMNSLSPRERSVLALLHDGLSVREVAELTGVREGTVRSQVKAVLRKLALSSQLAAVAQYDRWLQQTD